MIVTERWYSSDLQTVVMTKRSDPRMGETTFTLTNILRSEPDASLFQVPSDYTVVAGRPGRGPGRRFDDAGRGERCEAGCAAGHNATAFERSDHRFEPTTSRLASGASYRYPDLGAKSEQRCMRRV